VETETREETWPTHGIHNLKEKAPNEKPNLQFQQQRIPFSANKFTVHKLTSNRKSVYYIRKRTNITKDEKLIWGAHRVNSGGQEVSKGIFKAHTSPPISE